MSVKLVGGILATSLLILVLIIIFFVRPVQEKNNLQTTDLPESLQVTPEPKKVGNVPPPQLSAESALVVDLETDSVLFEKNPNLKLIPASLTKLATALVVLEECPLDKIITVPAVATITPGTKMNLVAGEKITIENLLYGLLLPSGNDAANTLVIGCFNNFEVFLSSVKKFTQNLGMNNTQFNNPTGLPAKSQYSTANDLLKLAKSAIAKPKIAEIVGTREKIVTNVTGEISHNLVNLNKLLQNPQILGIKTGTTAAGENLIVLKNNGDRQIISVILDSQNRFDDAEKILDWVDKNFVWDSN